jgi:hypothetical protein
LQHIAHEDSERGVLPFTKTYFIAASRPDLGGFQPAEATAFFSS